MKLPGPSPVDLTYCTNVHPGETWAETLASLKRYLPAVKQRVSPDQPFGVGLRLSADAAETLGAPDQLEAFKGFLAEAGLYVFTINGFPFGRFHGTRVKEAVYLPDWQDEARRRYSDRLADILVALLPGGREIDGSISTVPGAFKPRVKDQQDIDAMVRNLIGHALHLAGLEERAGRTLRLALEPEPCCFLETIEEAVDFFENQLFSKQARALVAQATGRAGGSEDLLRRHLGICFDVCHAAVEYEGDDVLDRLIAAGITVPKIQVSAALRLAKVDGATADLLRPFDDGVYFHQVVERNASGLTRYVDLDKAFASLDGAGGEREWRVHFHVPVFREALGGFATTQDYLKAILARQRASPVAPHLEVETYTWGVLPEADRHGDLAHNIAREIEWTKQELTG
jgi:sugar phosphate isomerase/epimerase